MAAEVPAKDVLCEAMEYLSKLGSNLRTRSDNLRDKKIRRDKLNNVLAVQKAANKILLICELSKKSLVNVETGIHKVLKIIDTSQSTTSKESGKQNKSDDEENRSKYYYFEYKSRKLRIKKRISLKHYTSVKVIAKSLPKSMMDKYPVHYDCKLYQMRRKQEKILKLQENSECNNVSDVLESSKHSHQNNSLSHDMSVISIPDTPTSCSASGEMIISNPKCENYEKNDISIISIPDTPRSKSDETDNDVGKSDISCIASNRENIQKSKNKSTKERSHSSDNDSFPKKYVTEDTNDSSKKISKSPKPKEKEKYQSEKFRRSSDSCQVEKHQSDREVRNKSNKSESEKKRLKKIRVINDSSDEEESKTDNVKDKVGETVSISNESDASCHEPETKKRKLSISSDNTSRDKNDTSEVLVKPIIKCVSLSKLLKPDVLEKKDSSKPLELKNKSIVSQKNKENVKLNIHFSRKQKEEEEYWIEKRKEISLFKSKKFVINITRLPELSIDYLSKLNVKKITQNGVTLCEVINKNDRENGTKLGTESEGDDNDLIAEANKVKFALLHESDSECEALNVTVQAQKAKNALCNQSDSDSDKNELSSALIKTKELKETLHGDSNSNTENETLKRSAQSVNIKNKPESENKTVTDQAENVKNTLLNDSESDSQNETTVKTADIEKSKININESVSDSENKTVVDSSHAEKVKHTLLNDSDSDTQKKTTFKSAKTKKLKKQLNQSFSDCENKTATEPSQAENENHTLSKITEHDTEKKTASVTAHVEKVKKTLLDGSDSDMENTKVVDSNSEPGNKERATENATKSKSDKTHSEPDGNNGDEERDKSMNEENDQKDLENTSHDNLSAKKNENTPQKKSSTPVDSDDKTITPLSQRLTPQSKKKRMRESMHAKKMLLTYSSSDTEDEELKNALKEIKDALLHCSGDESSSKKEENKHQSRGTSPSSSSSEDIVKRVKKKIKYDSSSSNEKIGKHRKKPKIKTTEAHSDTSKSSSRQMVRSKSKPGNSSSNNSDAQDSNDKDIDGLTNLNTLNKSSKTRRRRSNSPEMTEESSTSNTRSRRLKVKPTGLICDEMLKAESSSEAVSASGEENEADGGDIEDLPPVTLPNFNGDGPIEHLVKEDLLGESDTSVSNNESGTKEESEEEEKLNAKRRKANAISSDSEVGSSQKRDTEMKSKSEFSDSDSEPTKRSRRKKRADDSDASGASNSSNEGGKKKRRRIKSVRDSDVSGSESETEGRNKHGRKNIRKVMGKNQLEEATKKAAREEKERVARIAERQRMYNNLEFDESGKPDEVVLDKVILDFDPETKEPLIQVDRGLVKKLKPHQANGIKFMWDACFESAKRIRKDRGSGCILAHCMGLGKTLQVVTLTHTLLTHSALTHVQRVLVVCPLSTVLNWVNEFRMWLKHADTGDDVDVYELSRYKQNSERAFQLSQWFTHGGVCVLGYEMFRNLSADNTKKFKKKMLKNFQEALVDPGPDLVVCDEGHLLKNEKTSLSQSMNRVKTRRRIVLTGTPLQNNLKEYYCMVQFVKPNLLGKYNEYLNRFVNPITNGQYTDSTEHDIKIMKRRSHVLHKMLDGAVQRRDYGVLAPFLPPKHEYVLFITLSDVQTKLYQHYLDNFSRRPLPGKSSGFLFPDFQSLQRIWTHPLVLKYNSERYEIMQQKKRDKEEEDSEGSLVDFIDDDSTPDESSTEESSDDSSGDLSDDSRKKSKKKKSGKKSKGKDKEPKGEGGASRPRRGTRANPIDLDDDEKDDDVIEVKNENPTEWWIKLVEEEEIDDMRNSHKLVLLFDILRQCETIGDKLLVFSQSLYSLDLIEHFLGKVDEATQDGRIDEKLGGHVGSWSPGVDYFRLDGSTSCENRSIWCKNFNREDNPRARLFLISTRAGGLGINLVAANRVVIFDVSWNPSHDVQSIFRVYRFGQKKPCYVYRFLAMGTMEEKIYERQVTKQAISKRVIDEQQIDRHYAENDLAELYKFEPVPPSPRPLPPLPKDRLFAEMLREHEQQIYKYHEHDSLLENKEEETLSEEERKAAWEDFENEKNKPPPAPFPSAWPMHNGMVPGLLAQQQQQLAYAALAAMLRKDMPNLNDQQLRDMLPLIYNANPQMFGGYDYGLMQKMSEIYKYTQPGMMNAGMMNPMSAASGAGGMSGLGGSSGLQYEPPWQRQQQQQQQMRLQQLMQQQNQMGAKFYAGGLGSRDPVAMALQQQRAREIMLGNSAAAAAAAAAARPRGRPPAPPPDVVDLDSD